MEGVSMKNGSYAHKNYGRAIGPAIGCNSVDKNTHWEPIKNGGRYRVRHQCFYQMKNQRVKVQIQPYRAAKWKTVSGLVLSTDGQRTIHFKYGGKEYTIETLLAVS
jgi:hypothetical protein